MGYVNEGAWDRMVRVVLGLVLVYVGVAGVAGGVWGISTLAVGATLLVTGTVGWCPLYALFGFSTNHRRAGEAAP